MTSLLGQLKALIDEANDLIPETRRYIPDESEKAKRHQTVTRWMTNCESILRFAAIPTYLGKFQDVRRHDAADYWQIAQIAGLLQSASDMLASGFIGDLRSLVQAELLDSVIDQADLLYKSDHLLPAAVLGRIVLERWLRDLAKQKGIAEADNAKVTILNDRLKQAGAFSTPKWRQIQAGIDVGNSAAHGKVEEFSSDDVSPLLVFVRSVSS